MKRIVIHWTGGTNQPNNIEFQHYHFMINGDGVIIAGKFPVSANEVCRTDKNNNALYAAHTGGGNTGSIGVSLCGMLNFVFGKPESTKYPLKAVQCEACWKKVAELCKQYNIAVTPDTVLTHYEFGKKHPKTTSCGKPDISYLHPYPELKPAEIGDYIRNKVKWYLSKI